MFILVVSKRPRRRASKSTKTNQTIKRSRSRRHSQPSNQSITINQSHKTTNTKDDSSFDFFDIDTIFPDAYEPLFGDKTISEKYTSLI